MKKNIIRRITAFVISLCMAGMILPAPDAQSFLSDGLVTRVSAEGEDVQYHLVSTWAEMQTAIETVTPVGGWRYIRLANNITAGYDETAIKIPRTKSVDIDLNGYTLNRGFPDASYEGSVILVEQSAYLHLRNTSDYGISKITGGRAYNGGGINNLGTLYIDNVTISGNEAVIDEDGKGGCGGGVFSFGAVYTDSNTEIYNNTAESEGGGIYGRQADTNGYQNGDIYITDTRIYNNHAVRGGGISSSRYATVKDSFVYGNTAQMGGGIFVSRGRTTLKGSTDIYGNNAASKGGGVYQGGNLTVSDTVKIHNNTYTDLYVAGTNKIDYEKLEQGSEIYISAENCPRAITSVINTGTISSVDITSVFHPNAPFSMSYTGNGELCLNLPENETLYIERKWDSVNKTVTDSIKTQPTENITAVTGTNKLLDGHWYAVNNDTEFTDRLYVNGVVHIILCDGKKLTCKRGVEVGPGAMFIIHGQLQDTGKLIAKTANEDKAMIGSSSGDAGTIIIYGGYVEASDNLSYAAAIGAGKNGTPQDISIYGGEVYAKAWCSSSPGIGGGFGGRVVKNSIDIYGGKVYAYGESGIGGASQTGSGNNGTINIYGGDIRAEAMGIGAGIGGGAYNPNGPINIYDGQIYASAAGAKYTGAGIGSGAHAAQSGPVNIYGGVIAATSITGAGIGSGREADAGIINIKGGSVLAASAEGGAGIGGGRDGNGAEITIDDGVVYAVGGYKDEMFSTVHQWIGYAGGVKPKSLARYNDQGQFVDWQYSGMTTAGKGVLGLFALLYDWIRVTDIAGAGIGGGFDGSGKTCRINGGTVFAISGYNSASAIGWGAPGTFSTVNSGNLYFGDEMAVFSGNTIVSATIQAKDNRLQGCRNNMCAIVTKCPHQEIEYKFVNSDYHSATCKTCGHKTNFGEHQYNSDNECTICHTKAVNMTYIFIEKDSSGAEQRWTDTEFKNVEYTIPECRYSAPTGFEFIGWFARGWQNFIPGEKLLYQASSDEQVFEAIYLPVQTTTYIDENGMYRTVTARVLDDQHTAEYLTEGWYTVGADAQVGKLQLLGDVKLILEDGKNLNVGYGIDGRQNEKHPDITNHLTIFGQSGNTGKMRLTYYGVNESAFDGIFTQYGGNVQFNYASVYIKNRFIIAGGTFNAGYIQDNNSGNGELLISGGNVTIGNINNLKNVTLGWRTRNDSIFIGSFDNMSDKTFSIADKLFMTDSTNVYSGKLTAGEMSNIAGKTLTPWTKPAALEGFALSLRDGIGIKAYYSVNDQTSITNTGKAVISSPNQPDSEQKFDVIETYKDKSYYVFTYYVSAKEMGDTITIQIYDGDEPLGEPETTSVREIAELYLENQNGEYSAEEDIVESMLNYGEYSRLFFGNEAAEPVNKDHELNIGDVTISESYKYAVNALPENCVFDSATLSLKSRTSLSLYFISSETLTFNIDTSGGLYIETDTTTRPGYQICRIRGIKAEDLGKTITITVNGIDFTYCPLTYCYNVLNGGSADVKLQELCRALCYYYEAAKQYAQ
ncbi:hypothetical protein [Ruminococcus sp.]|uniref:hypothetical protein n=1 Tax=Ruminococcus sp. TaxID=41978 RepID=UPI0025877C79|nr:hypothetical protein [Ruminococcus sp.]MCR5021913.1 hypothetical protein [Ruminococcus sp.]